MRATLDFLKSLLIGGLFFLLPLGILIIIFGKLLSIAQDWGNALQDWLFPGAESPLIVLLLAILILTVIALMAGMIARTHSGKRTFGWFERMLLSRLPFYTLLQGLVPDLEGEARGGQRRTPVVTVRLDNQMLVGLLVDTTAKGKKIVYLPSAPTALSGTVAILDPDRVEETDIKPRDLFSGLRRLGTGMARLERK